MLLTPLRIAGHTFTHGLGTHATSRILLHLPAGASLYLPGNYLNTPLLATSNDPYAFRSQLGGSLCLGWHPRGARLDHAPAAKRIERFRELRHLAIGDFYPLIGHNLSRREWIGYQFHRPDLHEGMAVLFRREHSPYPLVEIQLRGLDPDTTYKFRDEDTGDGRPAVGAELADPLRISISDTPGSVLVTCRAVD